MKISYRLCTEIGNASNLLTSLLKKHQCKQILEIGSGANPSFSPEFVQAAGLSYVTSDVDERELEKSHPAFDRLRLDVTDPTIDESLIESFDCVLSRMVGEHIKDGEQYHRNIFSMLKPGAIAVHSFAALGCVPFIANRLMPEALSSKALKLVCPRQDEYRQGKFKAYYSWSQGPTRRAIRRFEDVGFEIIEYIGYFGHDYYERRLPWLHSMERLKSKILVNLPVPHLCSYATIVLRKPNQGIPHYLLDKMPAEQSTKKG